MPVTEQALWFIESHLDEELSLERVAAAVGVSRFHLSRTFHPEGMSLTAYVRARRLSRAAEAIAAGAPDLLAVAMEAGYGSHEAFTRAFGQQFGLSPERLRARGEVEGLALQAPLRMPPARPAALGAPRVLRREATHFLGLERSYETGAEKAGIPGQWREFQAHLRGRSAGPEREVYGVIAARGEDGAFDYLCAFAVGPGEGAMLPALFPAFTARRVPERRYAVFAHGGHVAGVGAAWQAIWESGLSEAGYTAAEGPSFVRCGTGFDDRSGYGAIDLWVPVD